MSSVNENYLDIFQSINLEKIIDHPNILIAANFWDADRYHAARVCYKFMRAIDDLIDDHKASHQKIAESEKKIFIANVEDWINAIVDKSKHDPIQQELLSILETFKIPHWPLEAFARSMIYDILNDGFPTLQTFLKYAEGASVAPASVFVHLCGIKKDNGQYLPPAFDLRKAASPCAVFSYLVHIIRDFQKDQFNNLNYFADDLIEKHGLSRQMLNNIAHGSPVTDNFRDLIREYYEVADEYRQNTYDMIKEISPGMEPRYQLSLRIIFNLYLMVFERIDIQHGTFTAKELNPTPLEVQKKVYETIVGFTETIA